jgi:hypothetical protein
MSDIKERLRDIAHGYQVGACVEMFVEIDDIRAAAAEIERLEAELRSAEARVAELEGERAHWREEASTAFAEAAVAAHERAAARAEAEALRKDAERYRDLRARFCAADFAYPEIGTALIFKWPATARISTSFDATVDAAREQGK